jgi:hypothetical protein
MSPATESTIDELRRKYAEQLEAARCAQRRGMMPQYATLLYQASGEPSRVKRSWPRS